MKICGKQFTLITPRNLHSQQFSICRKPMQLKRHNIKLIIGTFHFRLWSVALIGAIYYNLFWTSGASLSCRVQWINGPALWVFRVWWRIFRIWVCVLCHIASACSNTVRLYSPFKLFASPLVFARAARTHFLVLSLPRSFRSFPFVSLPLGSAAPRFPIMYTWDIFFFAFSLSHPNGNSHKAGRQAGRHPSSSLSDDTYSESLSTFWFCRFTMFSASVVICMKHENHMVRLVYTSNAEALCYGHMHSHILQAHFSTRYSIIVPVRVSRFISLASMYSQRRSVYLIWSARYMRISNDAKAVVYGRENG